MAITRIADVIDPEVLATMVLEKLPNNTILIPGVFTTADFPIGQDGTQWTIPYNKTLGALQTYVAGVPLTIQKMTQDTYRMVVIRKAAVYAADKIVKLAAYKDPMDFVATQLATETIPLMYMATQITVMDGGIPAANRYVPGTVMRAAAVRAAKLKLGDKSANLKHILMHSKQYGDLEANSEVIYQPKNTILPLYEKQIANYGLPVIKDLIATVAGLIIHVSDNCTLSGASPETYASYLMGDDAMGHFWQQNLNIDLYRDVRNKEDWISPDLDFVLNIHGMDYTSASYTVANLGNSANYTIKWNQKSIKLVRMVTL